MKRLLVFFVTFVSFVVPAVGLRAEVIEQILVRVNGEVFTKSDLEARQGMARCASWGTGCRSQEAR